MPNSDIPINGVPTNNLIPNIPGYTNVEIPSPEDISRYAPSVSSTEAARNLLSIPDGDLVDPNILRSNANIYGLAKSFEALNALQNLASQLNNTSSPKTSNNIQSLIAAGVFDADPEFNTDVLSEVYNQSNNYASTLSRERWNNLVNASQQARASIQEQKDAEAKTKHQQDSSANNNQTNISNNIEKSPNNNQRFIDQWFKNNYSIEGNNGILANSIASLSGLQNQIAQAPIVLPKKETAIGAGLARRAGGIGGGGGSRSNTTKGADGTGVNISSKNKETPDQVKDNPFITKKEDNQFANKDFVTGLLSLIAMGGMGYLLGRN